MRRARQPLSSESGSELDQTHLMVRNDVPPIGKLVAVNVRRFGD
jgi:hypothetical protein